MKSPSSSKRSPSSRNRCINDDKADSDSVFKTSSSIATADAAASESKAGDHWYKGGVNSNGTRNGQGSYIYKDICAVKLYSYDGCFSGGVKKDNSGRFCIEGTSEYVGTFKDGEISGEGERTWVEGGKAGKKHYKGEWLRGEFHGKGVWTLESANERYEGEFRNNKRHGMGILYKNDEIFKGLFTNQALGGFCNYIIQNKLSYEGEFVNNLICGQGRATWNKSSSYEGGFDQGLLSGKAYFATLDDSYVYEGRFAQGRMCKEDISAYIWAGIDRSMCPAVEDLAAAAAAGGKKTAPPAGKKGEAAPITTIVGGECLGKVTVKLGNHQQFRKDIDAAKVLAAGGGKAPAKGAPVVEVDEKTLTILPSNPEPRSVLSERFHKVRLQFQRVICDDATAISAAPHSLGQGKQAKVTLGEPIEFLHRNKNVSEVAASLDRFPPNSFVFKNGKNESFSKRFDECLSVTCGTRDPSGDAFAASSSAKDPKIEEFGTASVKFSSFNHSVDEAALGSPDSLIYNLKFKNKVEESLFGDSLVLSSDFFISDSSIDQCVLSWKMTNASSSLTQTAMLILIKKPLLEENDRIEVVGKGRAKCIRDNKNCTFDVQFEDMSAETAVPESAIRFLEKPYNVGDSVEILRIIMNPLAIGSECTANYKGTGEWKSCTVEKCRADGTFDCSYADGKYETRIHRNSIREKGSQVWTVGTVTSRSIDCSFYDVQYTSTDNALESGVASSLIRNLEVVKPVELTPSWELRFCSSQNNTGSNNEYTTIMRWRQDESVSIGSWHSFALSIASNSMVDLYFDGDARIKLGDKHLDVSPLSDSGLSKFDEVDVEVGKSFKGGISNVCIFSVADQANLSKLTGSYLNALNSDYNRTASADIDCFCGEGTLEWSQVKFLDSVAEEGLYVCIISDAVHSSICLPEPSTANLAVSALPIDLGTANMVYSKLYSNSQIICKLASKSS